MSTAAVVIGALRVNYILEYEKNLKSLVRTTPYMEL